MKNIPKFSLSTIDTNPRCPSFSLLVRYKPEDTFVQRCFFVIPGDYRTIKHLQRIMSSFLQKKKMFFQYKENYDQFSFMMITWHNYICCFMSMVNS